MPATRAIRAGHGRGANGTWRCSGHDTFRRRNGRRRYFFRCKLGQRVVSRRSFDSRQSRRGFTFVFECFERLDWGLLHHHLPNEYSMPIDGMTRAVRPAVVIGRRTLAETSHVCVTFHFTLPTASAR